MTLIAALDHPNFLLQEGRFALNYIVIFTGLWHTVRKNKTRNFHHEKNVSIFRA